MDLDTFSFRKNIHYLKKVDLVTIATFKSIMFVKLNEDNNDKSMNMDSNIESEMQKNKEKYKAKKTKKNWMTRPK